MKEQTPKSMRLHVGLFGRTNVGKSTFLNLLAGQDVAIVSPQAGTTTDPVEKSMELLPIGPVVFTDTGGVDDATALGEKRREKMFAALRRMDVAGRQAVGLQRELTDAELHALVRDLSRTEMPYTSPRGKPTVVLFGMRELNRKFGRE